MPGWVWIVLGPAAFAAWFCLVVWVVAWTGGWRALARRYRAARVPEGKRFTWQSGRLGWAGYNNCLTIRVSPDGLYLAVPIVFRAGHPPLLIPWADLHVRQVRERWWAKDVTLAVGDPEVARLRLPLHVLDAAEQIRAGAASPERPRPA